MTNLVWYTQAKLNVSKCKMSPIADGHLALHESLITLLTLSVMREQLRLQRLPHHDLNETQRHVVRQGVLVRIGSPSEDTVYAHKRSFLRWS